LIEPPDGRSVGRGGYDVKAPENPLVYAIGLGVLVLIPMIKCAITSRDVANGSEVEYAEGTVGCRDLMQRPDAVDLGVWLKGDEARTVAGLEHEASVDYVEGLAKMGAARVLLGIASKEAGPEIATAWVAVLPKDAAGKRAYLKARGKYVDPVKDPREPCESIYSVY
jgi:hypothetical protein